MKEYLLNLLEYERWANDKIVDAISRAIDPPGRTMELTSHLIAVSSIWLSRATEESEKAKRFDLYTLEECRQRNNINHDGWRNFLDSFDNREREEVSFNFLGQPSRTNALNCLNQMIIHSSYHRGQIVLLLKGHLPELPAIDFILFAKETSQI